ELLPSWRLRRAYKPRWRKRFLVVAQVLLHRFCRPSHPQLERVSVHQYWRVSCQPRRPNSLVQKLLALVEEHPAVWLCDCRFANNLRLSFADDVDPSHCKARRLFEIHAAPHGLRISTNERDPSKPMRSCTRTRSPGIGGTLRSLDTPMLRPCEGEVCICDRTLADDRTSAICRI